MSLELTGIVGVVFDLDDTLYPERNFAYSGFAAVAEWLRARFTCPADPAQRLRAMFDQGRRGRLFDELLAEWQCHAAPAWVPQMVECFRAHEPALRLYEDARGAIERWKGNFRLGLITDGLLATQQRKLSALRLAEYLDPIICTDVWGRAYWKPHPRAFEEIERAWGCTGRECVYMADNAARDFVAPNQLGWRTVQISRPGGEYCQVSPAPRGEPQFKVDSLDVIHLIATA